MKTETASRYVAGLAFLIFGSSGQATEQPSQPYVMAVMEDQTYGQLVLDGFDDVAIDKITRSQTRQKFDFHDSLALCVAYTRSRQIENATVACDDAMEKSMSRRDKRRSKHWGLSSMSVSARSNFALAASNRGVLQAITGDPASATESFEAAIAANPDFEVAKANLARVSSR